MMGTHKYTECPLKGHKDPTGPKMRKGDRCTRGAE
jgi:hypothetical protein